MENILTKPAGHTLHVPDHPVLPRNNTHVTGTNRIRENIPEKVQLFAHVSIFCASLVCAKSVLNAEIKFYKIFNLKYGLTKITDFSFLNPSN